MGVEPDLPSPESLRPGRLWSLNDMHRLYVSGLFTVINLLGVWRDKAEDDKPVHEENRLHNAEALESYFDTLKTMGASGAQKSLEKITTILRAGNCTYGDFTELTKEAHGRLLDETDDREFFALTPREEDFYSNPRKGWENSIKRFPGIVDDVEEASKCFALSRYPAAIFHSVQIVECALIELGKFIGVKDPKSGWTAVSGALSKIVKKERKDQSAFERRNYAFLEQLQGTVEGLKNAWRNKISHIEGRLVLLSKDFSPDIAEEILFATRAFVRRLQEGLPAPKTKPTI